MKSRFWWAAAAGVLAVVVVGMVVLREHRLGTPPGPGTAASEAESGYRASDPALMASTGRPQLVEFFHHA